MLVLGATGVAAAQVKDEVDDEAPGEDARQRGPVEPCTCQFTVMEQQVSLSNLNVKQRPFTLSAVSALAASSTEAFKLRELEA